jgi:hypothetical protein
MFRYRNAHWGFEVTFPNGWREYGFWDRLRSLRRYDPTQPEFAGPKGADLKIAIGPADPVRLVEMQRNLAAIAERHGHCVLEVKSIAIGGKEHATIVYHIPLDRPELITDRSSQWYGYQSGRTLRAKNYHLIF